jgi:hypothetical protein
MAGPTAPAPLKDRGVHMLAVFVLAMFSVVVAVVVLGAVDADWILVPVMLFDFAATAAVLLWIGRLLRDDDDE